MSFYFSATNTQHELAGTRTRSRPTVTKLTDVSTGRVDRTGPQPGVTTEEILSRTSDTDKKRGLSLQHLN